MEPLAPGISGLPLRSRTLPPATTTNALAVGGAALTVVDPASPWEEEHEILVESLEADGRPVERIVLTHHHDDHVAGVERMRRELPGVPVLAHALTAERLRGTVRVDGHLADGDVLDCGGRELVVLHTPGHAPGHLALHDPASGAVVAGDLVAGQGTIALDPADGDLQQYLDSLERLRRLEPAILVPAHGPPVTRPTVVLETLVSMRHQRSEQIRRALDRLGGATAAELVPLVYPGTESTDLPVAVGQVRVHLAWLAAHGLAAPLRDDRWGPAR